MFPPPPPPPRVLTIWYTENAGVVASTRQLLATLQSIPEAIFQ